MGTNEDARKTQMLRENKWKTQGNFRCGVGTYRKRKENTRLAWEHIKNAMKTHVLRRSLWKTQGKLRFCVGTYKNQTKTQMLRGNLWKRNENAGVAWELMENAKGILGFAFAWEPMENALKILVLHWNILTTQRKHRFCVRPMETTKKTQVLHGIQWKTQGQRRLCEGTYDVTPWRIVTRGDRLIENVWLFHHTCQYVFLFCWSKTPG